MTHLARLHPKPGEHLQIPNLLHLAGICWAEDLNEVKFILDSYLLNERGYLVGVKDSSGRAHYQISPQGWAYLDDLSKINADSSVGFIAMWFDDSMAEAWQAIDQGIRSAGYDALRIDQRQHNNKIDDEIVAGIRRSRFLVADFTGHRGGVYFEAGFAMGLGLPVIWLCRKDELAEVHFDTRQYNFIVWEQSALAALSDALHKRIEATIERGPLPSTSAT